MGRGVEPRSLGSKSKVLARTPWGQLQKREEFRGLQMRLMPKDVCKKIDGGNKKGGMLWFTGPGAHLGRDHWIQSPASRYTMGPLAKRGNAAPILQIRAMPTDASKIDGEEKKGRDDLGILFVPRRRALL